VTTDPPDKKGNVIHTRVPDELDAEIKRRAQSLGMSVSNLVRNALAHAFGLVGDIVADSASIARSARGLGPAIGQAPSHEPPGAVLGWTEAILNLNAVCSQCNSVLLRGTVAAIAVPGGGAFLCRACLEELQHAK
jgi:hypothetical protein